MELKTETTKPAEKFALHHSMFVPKKMFFTKGVGHHRDELRSFELALRDAGIEKSNLVYVSSILPPECDIVTREAGSKEICPGMITFCVMARSTSNEPGRLIASSIGCAVPANKNDYGYLSEYHTFGEDGKEAGDKAEDLAAAMLSSTLGIEFDEDKSWDEKEETFKLNNKIYETHNVTAACKVEKGGYTTALAATILLF
ncbi:MAG: arginine decarboxylase [Candidatus Omnitrophota bacterium]|jgi:arginine decarboxylase